MIHTKNKVATAKYAGFLNNTLKDGKNNLLNTSPKPSLFVTLNTLKKTKAKILSDNMNLE